MKKISVEISHKTIVFTLVLLLSLWLIYQIQDILFGLFISLILVGAFNPTVSRLETKGIPRWLAGLSLYIVLLLLLGGSLAVLIPAVVVQTTELIRVFPTFASSLEFLPLSPSLLSSQIAGLGSLSSGLIQFTVSIFANTFSIIVILVVSFYLLLEHNNLDKYLLDLFGKEGQEKSHLIIKKLEKTLGSWVKAQLLLMFFIGLFSYLGFLLLGLKFALPLALLAGLLEIIPNVGPVIAGIPAVLIGLFASPVMALAVAAWCFLIQQVENSILVPRVMKEVAGVNPVVSLLSVIIGLKLAGIGGGLLAIPAYLTIRTILSEFVAKK